MHIKDFDAFRMHLRITLNDEDFIFKKICVCVVLYKNVYSWQLVQIKGNIVISYAFKDSVKMKESHFFKSSRRFSKCSFLISIF